MGSDSSVAYNYSNNQVFHEHDYAVVINALQDAQAQGSGAVATTALRTVENAFWGIPAGFNVTVMWIYLGRAFQWEAQIPPELKELQICSQLYSVLPYESFATDALFLKRRAPIRSFSCS